MRVFPNSRSGWIRAGLIFLVVLAVAAYRNVFALGQLLTYDPMEGDIVFQSLPHGELVDAIEGITQSEWSHCGVVMQKGGHWVVVEAIGYVHETPLPLWIPRGRHGRFAVYRATENPSNHAAALRGALLQFMDRPYDFRYAPGDAEIYCSELVFKAYHNAYGKDLGNWEKLGELNWKPFESFIRRMEGGDLPLSREMITPVGLTRSSSLQCVYPKPK